MAREFLTDRRTWLRGTAVGIGAAAPVLVASAAQAGGELRDGRREHVGDAARERDLQVAPHVRGHVGDVLFVLHRHDDRAHAGAMRGEQLLADAADRQHEAAQRDLAGHREVAAHGAAAQSPPASPERPAAVNLEDLAGIWSGVATHGQRDDYVELRIRGDGTYEMTSARQIGVFRGQGVLVPADGGYELRGDSGRTGALEIARDPSGRPVLRLDATIHGGQRVSANLRRAR